MIVNKKRMSILFILSLVLILILVAYVYTLNKNLTITRNKLNSLNEFLKKYYYMNNTRNNYLLNHNYVLSEIFNDAKHNELYKNYLLNSDLNKGNNYTENEYKVQKYDNKRFNTILKDYYLILEYTNVFGASKFCKKGFNKNISELFRLNNRFNNIFAKQIKAGDANIDEFEYKNKYYHQLDGCIYKNCFFTCDKTLINDSDALLFHYNDLAGDVKKSEIDYKNLLSNRDLNQLWMLWHDEPTPVNKQYDYFKFNWTISFYKHSDISYFAYGGLTYQVEKTFNNNYDSFKEFILNEFNKRSNNAIWFVSNCASKFRLKFAVKLGIYFPLIINGECNNEIKELHINEVKSKDSKISLDNRKCTRETECELNYLNNNKFYLAFESTDCTNYITEKFWRTLSFGMIPIVIQPSKESYESIAPKDSFIHAQDFDNDAYRVAQYMDQVAKNSELYLKHMKWRFEYKAIYSMHDVEPFRMCELCSKLNTQLSSSYYETMSEWFHHECKKY